MKKIISLLLVIVMLITVSPVSVFAENVITSGKCGDDLTYVIDDTGTLTISGTGEMYDFYFQYDYNYEQQPWNDYRDFITNVVIEYGATGIGNYAFYGFSVLEEISIPNSVKSIGWDVFEDCLKLKDLVIPEGVASMYSINFCYGLESLTLPASLTEIIYNSNAFWNCPSLKEVIVHEDNQNYKSVDGVLYTKDTTELLVYPAASTRTRYDIPEGVTTIWNWAFSCARNLKEITVPDTVTDMGEGTFAYCLNLESIKLSDNIDRIEYDVFNGCIRLKAITIPANVQYLYAQCFLGCVSIEKIIIKGNNFDLTDYNEVAFVECISLKDLYVMNPETHMGYLGYTSVNQDYSKDEIIAIADDAYRSFDNDKFDEFYNILYNSSDELTKIEDVVIHGYYGSTAEAYANEHGFKFVPICDHLNTEVINTATADCKNDGYTGDIYCNDCEEIIEYGETVPSAGHNYIENIIKEPTYSQDGLKNTVCDNCGDTTAEEVIPQLTIEDSEEKENSDTDISIIYPEGVFDGEIEVEVTPVAEGDAFKLISNKQGNYKVTMFDINVTVDGEKVQPDGTVLVKIPLPKGYNQNKCVVYYVAEDGTMEELTTYHYKDGYVYFETDHFSYYAILEAVENTEPEEDNTESSMSFFDKLIEFFKKIIEFIKNLFA